MIRHLLQERFYLLQVDMENHHLCMGMMLVNNNKVRHNMEKVVTVSSNTLKQSIKVKDILISKLTKAGYYVSDKIEKNTELLISIGEMDLS